MASKTAYTGSRRKILLAFDVGTTYSGISYSILDPDRVPSIASVTRFPGQEEIANVSKIPTIIYYSKEGKVKAIGAEATSDGILEQAMDEGWRKVEWFKLHLRSKRESANGNSSKLTPLPPNKTIIDVFADFLAYLLKCSASYIADTHPNGTTLWRDLRSEIQFVLSHPNGWEGKEQSQMRKAAVKAGLIPHTHAGHRRLTFVTEGEASLHFAIENGILSHVREGDGIVIVDAGGGTIDISSYRANNTVSASESGGYEEIAAAQCHFSGSVYVTMAAEKCLEDVLKDSEFANDLDHILRCFDKTTKHRFKTANDPYYVKFGSTRDNDPACNIRFGQLRVEGTQMAEFYQPSIDIIVESVAGLTRTALNEIKHVILVGGFSTSDYLFKNVREDLEDQNLIVVRPEQRINKAVSDGAVSFYLDHYVRSRVSKVGYGHAISEIYDKSRPDHFARSHMLFTDVEGDELLSNYFALIVPKNTKISEEREFRLPFRVAKRKRSQLENRSMDIYAYRGPSKCPEWMDVYPEHYSHVCQLKADLSRVPRGRLINSEGRKYYAADYEVVLLLGLTELKAYIAWNIKGQEFRSPAAIIYADD